MTPEAQRITIAEACGWTRGKRKELSFSDARQVIECDSWIHPSGYPERKLPDYLNDLNAMAEADKVLNRLQQELRAVHLYCILTGREFEQLKAETGGGQNFSITAWMANELLNSTAAQRAEAFLKAIGKWKD